MSQITLDTFRAISNATGTGVVQLDGTVMSTFKSGGTYHSGNLLGRLFRSGESSDNNNEIRTALLRALAEDLDGIGEFHATKQNNEVVLNETLVTQLKNLLGDGIFCSKSGAEFKIGRDGKVSSGCPLTERRLTAILDQVDRVKQTHGIQVNNGPAIERKALTAVLADQVAAQKDVLMTHFTAQLDMKGNPALVGMLRNAIEQTVKKFGFDRVTDELQVKLQDEVYNYKTSFHSLKVMAVDQIALGLINPQKNYANFFKGVTLLNDIVKDLNEAKGVKPEDKRAFTKFDPVALIKEISLQCDIASGKVTLPTVAKPIDPQNAQLNADRMIALIHAGAVSDKQNYASFEALCRATLETAANNNRPGRPNGTDVLVTLLTKLRATNQQAAYNETLLKVGQAVQERFLKGGDAPANSADFSKPFTIGESGQIVGAVMTAFAAFKADPNDPDKPILPMTTENLAQKLSEAFDVLNLQNGLKLTPEQAKQALNDAAATILSSMGPQGASELDAMLQEGGGMFKCEQNFQFDIQLPKSNTKLHITSSFKPAPADINPTGVKVNGKKVLPTTNLGVSSLTLKAEGAEEENTISFVRFGQSSAWKSLNVAKDSDIADINVKNYHDHKNIATLILKNNPALLEKAKADGKVEVPIWRVDMCGIDECLLKTPDQPFTFTVNVDGKDVQVTSPVHHLHVPCDSNPNKGNQLIKPSDFKETYAAFKLLMNEANAFIQKNPDSAEGKKIKSLHGALDYYDRNVLALVDENEGLLVKDNYGRGVELLGFGAKVALLASLLGKMPAINCNWGRDRTSAMDSEIKFLATQLEMGRSSQGINNLYDSTSSSHARHVNARTDFLIKSGNAQMAKRMNHYAGPINLMQSGKDYGEGNGLASGFDTAYNVQNIT